MSAPNTVALDYNDYVTQIATLAALKTLNIGNVVSFDDTGASAPGPNDLLPQMINYAELRIQRDLDLLPSLISNTSYSTTPGSNTIALSVNDFVTVKTITYVSGSQKIPLLPTSKEFLENVYNDSAYLAPPQYFAMIGADTDLTGNLLNVVSIGPYPDEAYPVVIRGTQRLPSLNQYNTDPDASTLYTFISAYLPDLMLMASMVYLSNFQRNFGRSSDDPQMAVTYESQYSALLKGASVEEARKRFAASAWTSQAPPTVATANR